MNDDEQEENTMNKKNHNHLHRIAFGSCNNQNLTQPLWDILIARDPIAFIWAGDAIYADHFVKRDWTKFPPESIHSSATPQRFQQYYAKQLQNSNYTKFLNQTKPFIFGTIDDHDMGCNNGDEKFEYKQESGVHFMEFVGMSSQYSRKSSNNHDNDALDTDEDDRHNFRKSIMYSRAEKGYGVYGVKVFDFGRNLTTVSEQYQSSNAADIYLLSDIEANLDPDLVGYHHVNHDEKEEETNPTYSNKSVAIFVLDVRTNKTPWKKGLDGWRPNYKGDMLGERQWKWFETAIRNSKASVNVIVTGLQVHPYRFPHAETAELWSQFPTSRQRLYDAILQDGVQAPIIISGDVHMAQLMRKQCVKLDSETMDNRDLNLKSSRPLIELTTSGMTHSWGTCFASSERYHNTWRYYWMHFISKSFMTVIHNVFPMPDLMISTNNNNNDMNNEKIKTRSNYENGGAEGANQGKQYSLELNFGELEFDWDDRTVSARIFGRVMNAPPLISAKYSMDQLSGLKSIPGGLTDDEIYNSLVSDDDHGIDRWRYLLVDGRLKSENGGNDSIPTKLGEYVCVNHRPTASLLSVILGYIGTVGCFCMLAFGPQILICIMISKVIKLYMRKRG